MSLSRFARDLLLHASRLVPVAVGALLLIADSALCPDGYAQASFDANYTSDCPVEFLPAVGQLSLRLPAGAGDPEPALMDGLRAAEINATRAKLQAKAPADGQACVPSRFSLEYEVGDTRLRCGEVSLGGGDQAIACHGRGILETEAGAVEETAVDASTDASAPELDGGPDADADADGDGDASPSKNKPSDPQNPSAGSRSPRLPEPTRSAPATAISCTIHFRSTSSPRPSN